MAADQGLTLLAVAGPAVLSSLRYHGTLVIDTTALPALLLPPWLTFPPAAAAFATPSY